MANPLKQLRVYKDKVHIANVPIQVILDGIVQVPWQAIDLMEDFVRGRTALTRYGRWSWEWMEAPLIVP